MAAAAEDGAVLPRPVLGIETVDRHRQEIAALARGALADLFGFVCRGVAPAPSIRLPAALRVNVTARRRGVLLGSMSGSGESLAEQIVSAVANTVRDARYGGPLCRIDAERVALEVWVQYDRAELTVDAVDEGRAALGVDGFELALGEARAYYKPSVAVTRRMRSVAGVFGRLSRKAGLEADGWRDPAAQRWKTQWVAVVCASVDSAPLTVRGIRSLRRDPVSAAMLLEQAGAGCAYLRNSQGSRGDIAYVYDPMTDRTEPTPANIVRTCGCLYALASASAVLNDGGQTLDTAARLADHLLGRLGRHGGVLALVDTTRVPPKLGATALFAAALGILASSDRRLAEPHDELIRSVLSAQREDGRFSTHFGVAEPDPRVVDFYPGQALLALTQRAERGDAAARDACIAAFEPYRDHFHASPATAFVGWQIEVWARLAVLTGRDDFAGFAFEQADWLAARQIAADRDDERVGGFSRDGRPPTFSSIVFTEALIAALVLADRVGDRQRRDGLARACLAGISFARTLSLESVPPLYLANAERCRGGVALSASDLSIRCDVVQHFITLCLRAWQARALLPLR